MTKPKVAIVGGGPAGLCAAEVLAHSCDVTIYDSMPTVARKFLLAGKSGLNITHAEDYANFASRFGNASPRLRPALDLFNPDELRNWARELGTETFVGSSGRVFPEVMKASPLLRAWLKRLHDYGVRILTRHRWIGFDEHGLVFEMPAGRLTVSPDAALFALGGASWPRLGSDAAWVEPFERQGVVVVPFKPANCGFDVGWSEVMRARFAGAAVKTVTATSPAGTTAGEFVITAYGIEGGLVYTHAASLRDELEREQKSFFRIDLMPGRTQERIAADLARQNPKASFATRLKKGAGLDAVKVALVREVADEQDLATPSALAATIKSLSIPLMRPRPIAEAISSAGGVCWSEIDADFMLRRMPGVFVAGEMLNWEAPTGGYLLTACMASGRAAGNGAKRWLESSCDKNSTEV